MYSKRRQLTLPPEHVCGHNAHLHRHQGVFVFPLHSEVEWGAILLAKVDTLMRPSRLVMNKKTSFRVEYGYLISTGEPKMHYIDEPLFDNVIIHEPSDDAPVLH